MAIRKIRTESDDILRKQSKPVKEINKKILDLLDDMHDTMIEAEGIGLAAPQIGILKRIVIVDVGEGLIELINPEFVETTGEQERTEGCLSVPGKSGFVKRPMHVKVKALNRNGEEIIVEGDELKAVAFCHEIDHLNGVLYIDKVTRFVSDEDEDDENNEDESN